MVHILINLYQLNNPNFSGMFDFNNNGTIDFNEFCSLWQYVTDWTRTFKNYDLDGNGTINHQELSQGKIPFFVRFFSIYFWV